MDIEIVLNAENDSSLPEDTPHAGFAEKSVSEKVISFQKVEPSKKYYDLMKMIEELVFYGSIFE